MLRELAYFGRKGWQGPAETVYFGGGTPSLLTVDEIARFVEEVARLFGLAAGAEITLEANPDDLDPIKIKALRDSPVNRLSVGIQSFDQGELRWMNRAHTSKQALDSLEGIARYFDNFSLDLIYGIPGSDLNRWRSNLSRVLDFQPPHISAYALTVEPRTALHSFVKRGLSPDVDEGDAQEQFQHMVATLEEKGYDHYEISNFARPGYYSQNNSGYWQGKSYLGIGPAAHSYDGHRRWWNPAHNLRYVKALEKGGFPGEVEELSARDRYNETVMMGLRTSWGVSLGRIREDFGPHYEAYLRQQAGPYLREQLLFMDGDILYTARKGKFLVDGIASDLFMINLK